MYINCPPLSLSVRSIIGEAHDPPFSDEKPTQRPSRYLLESQDKRERRWEKRICTNSYTRKKIGHLVMLSTSFLHEFCPELPSRPFHIRNHGTDVNLDYYSLPSHQFLSRARSVIVEKSALYPPISMSSTPSQTQSWNRMFFLGKRLPASLSISICNAPGRGLRGE
jgi:hypothetical protein